MCGLFGLIQSEPLDQSALDRADNARDTLHHRGPDNAGSFHENNIYIGHRRLSIIDTSPSGNQPMIDHGIVITVNGEIYNFKTLRAELEEQGAHFRSGSDSEVILHGYRVWGIEKLADKIDGMYVATIYDPAQNQLTILRDRAGIKPLYYYHHGRNFAYASELKALKCFLNAEDVSINPEAVIDFLTYRYIPAPKSLYKNIYKLPAASILTINTKNPEKVEISKYWNLSTDTVIDGSNTTFSDRLRTLLRKSVNEQMVSDVPLGLLLSGGIDSSAIAAMAVEQKAKPLSFTIGFRNKGRDESTHAEAVSKTLHTTHYVHYLDDEEMHDLAQTMAAWFDEPFGDTSAIPTFRVSDFAKQHVTVALSGDGGDELFGGYNWYKQFDTILKKQAKIPVKFKHGLPLDFKHWRLRHVSLLFMKDPIELYARLRGSLPFRQIQKWKKKLGVDKHYDHLWAYRAHYDPQRSPVRNARIIDFHTYLPDDILTKVDRVSMAVSLECRPPFLSRALIEYAYSLPDSYIMHGGTLKGGLKHALRNDLPHDILFRKKQGFSVPDHGWRRRAVRQYGSLQEFLLHPFLNNSIRNAEKE